MSNPTILVTGATGKTGGAVASQLLLQGARVRVLVRTRDARSRRLHDLGAEVVIADMFDPLQVEAALAGVSRLYYLPPWHPYMVQSAAVFATAARRAGVEAIVGLSQWLANPSHPSLATRQNCSWTGSSGWCPTRPTSAWPRPSSPTTTWATA